MRPRRAVAGRPAAPVHQPAVLVVVLLLVYLVQDNGSFGAIEALGISNAALPLALVAAGETFVILTNGIDLSVGSIVTLSNVTSRSSPATATGSSPSSSPSASGLAAGLLNGSSSRSRGSRR